MSTPFHLVACTPLVIEQVLQAVPASLITLHPLVGNTLHRDDLALAVHAAESASVLIELDLTKVVAFGDTCSRVRGHHSPVVALVDSVPGAVAAIVLGADATHPLPPSLDLLRAQELGFRRTRSAGTLTQPQHESDEAALQVGEILLDQRLGTLRVADREARIPSRQARVLACLLREPGAVVSRTRLLADAWGWEFDPGTNVVGVYIHYLRRKLAEVGFRGVIETVRGHGYRLVAASVEPAEVSESESQSVGESSAVERTAMRH